MKGDQEGTPPEISLQSKDHEELLDVVDALQSCIGHHIDLPQLIVCGDQSSGKSFVVEAISGLHFPTNFVLCTRFATELVFRNPLGSNEPKRFRNIVVMILENFCTAMQNDANSQYNQEEASETIVVMQIDSRSSPGISYPSLCQRSAIELEWWANVESPGILIWTL
jgi:hypothetical protein